jgi:ribosomal protein L33
MSQDNLIKLVSAGTDDGAGKGHIIYSYKNKKKLKERLQLKKFNPQARAHTLYVEKK